VQSLKKQIGQGTIPEVASFDRLKYAIGNACLLLNQPVQSITNEIPDNSIDFVLTDPPYFDQVAYSEYGKIWEFFCGYKANFEDEIIVSQRDVCQSDEALYLKNLQKAFEVIFKKMKPNAMMLVYFKDSRPEKMFAFLDILDKAGFYFVGQEYLETAKFTYKQNSTTKTTLAGESILKLQKALPTENAENEEAGKEITFIEIENLITHFAKTYLLTHTVASLNEILSNGLIKLLYDYKALTFLKKAKDITDILEKLANYDDEKRTYTLKNKELKNQLFLGNCLEILKAIPSQSIDCVITDPPYNISGYDHKKQIGWLKSNDYWKKDKAFKKIDETWDKFSDDDYETFTIEWLMELKRIVKPNGNIAIFGSYHNIYKIGYLIEKLDLKTINSIIWYKRNAFPNVTQRMFCESTEQIIWCVNNSKKDAKNWTFNYQTMKELNGGVQMRNLFDVPLTKASEKEHGKHPSQKPLEVLNNLVLALTNEGDVVLDCFLGSGTTAVSALQHKRNFIGIEQNYEYLQLAERRLEGVNIVSKPIKKDITYLGVDKIYHGLAEKLLANIPSESIACSVWSPPYHVGKEYEKEQSFEGWKNMLKQVIRLHYPITKKGGFMVINIADILCFPDETMPKIQLPNPSKHKVKLSKEEILEVKLKNPTWGKYDLANYFQCSEQTIDRRLHGNNIRGGKYITQTRIELVSQYIQEYAQEAGFYLYDRRVWKKDPSWHNSRWVSNSYRSVDEFEYIYMFWKAGETLINKDKLSSKEWSEWGSRAVWEFPSVRANQEHEAMFPLELPKRCIKLLTEEGDVVLDPFMGSGTTALACLETKRHFIGIEKEAQYIDLALKNIEKYTQKHQQLFIV
jgi:site-specific DNA-methyltransferase (adenine-specific)